MKLVSSDFITYDLIPPLPKQSRLNARMALHSKTGVSEYFVTHDLQISDKLSVTDKWTG